eukprot:5827986-Prymnesium_polylepis.1
MALRKAAASDGLGAPAREHSWPRDATGDALDCDYHDGRGHFSRQHLARARDPVVLPALLRALVDSHRGSHCRGVSAAATLSPPSAARSQVQRTLQRRRLAPSAAVGFLHAWLDVRDRQPVQRRVGLCRCEQPAASADRLVVRARGDHAAESVGLRLVSLLRGVRARRLVCRLERVRAGRSLGVAAALAERCAGTYHRHHVQGSRRVLTALGQVKGPPSNP